MGVVLAGVAVIRESPVSRVRSQGTESSMQLFRLLVPALMTQHWFQVDAGQC
jgi:hypothetical protein